MKSRESYDILASALKSIIFPKLELGCGNVDELLKHSIVNGQKIIVYGAGALAKSFVQYLLCLCNYNKQQILVVVSERGNNTESLCGIDVLGFKELEEENKKWMVVIAVADCGAQETIKNTLVTSGFEKNVRMGYEEIATLVRQGLS